VSLVLDIETRPLPTEQLDAIAPEFRAPSNYKDEAKIAASIAEQRAEWRDRAALSALTGRVVLVGTFDTADNDTVQWHLDEAGGITEQMTLQAFWHDTWPEGVIVGWNIKGFDLPFLVQRSRILGVDTPRDLFQGRYWNTRVRDLMDEWGCFAYGARTSLDSVARALGLPGKTSTGKDSLTMDMPELLAYNAADLATTAAVAKRMGIL
jgi:hypothetical protein